VLAGCRGADSGTDHGREYGETPIDDDGGAPEDGGKFEEDNQEPAPAAARDTGAAAGADGAAEAGVCGVDGVAADGRAVDDAADAGGV
jgi:hypothetical protein